MNYRDILRQTLAQRIKANPRYSLRAMARDLKFAPSRLSEILNGKQGLSLGKATEIAEILRLSDEEKQLMLDSVEQLHSKNPKRRVEAGERLRSRLAAPDYLTLSNDSFAVVANWYHFAIVQLIELAQFESNPSWISSSLGISEDEASVAVDRLLRLGVLVSVDGQLRATNGFVTASDGSQSEAIQTFHKQILTKALAALDTQTVEERDFSAMIFAMPKDNFKTACEMIKSFRRNLSETMNSATTKDELYSVSIQLMKLTK